MIYSRLTKLLLATSLTSLAVGAPKAIDETCGCSSLTQLDPQNATVLLGSKSTLLRIICLHWPDYSQYGDPLTAFVKFVVPIIQNVSTNAIFLQPFTSTPAQQTVVRPSPDFLFSNMAIDLSHEDLVFTVPPVDAGRYYIFAFFDMWVLHQVALDSKVLIYHIDTGTTSQTWGVFLVAPPVHIS